MAITVVTDITIIKDNWGPAIMDVTRTSHSPRPSQGPQSSKGHHWHDTATDMTDIMGITDNGRGQAITFIKAIMGITAV
jgi:hypothetical protein